MSNPKYLRHRDTGVVFPYNATLAKRNRNMEPFNGEGEAPFFGEVDATGDLNPGDLNPGGEVLEDLDLPDTDTDTGAEASQASEAADNGGLGGGGGLDDQQLAVGAVSDTVITDGPMMVGEVPLHEATKAQLVGFAQTAFGVTLAKQSSVETLRTKVAELLAKG